MSRNPKVVKFHSVPTINIGIIIFSLIFVFIVVQIIRSMNQDHISVYEVQNSYMDSDITGIAMILRSETLVNTSQAGYVNYYIRNGERVGKNSTVYTLDSTGTLNDLIAEASANGTQINNAGYSQIRSSISAFQNYFSDSSFSDVYDFKYDLESQVLDIANTQVLEELTSAGSNVTFNQVASPQSGIVTYYQDGYEDKTPDTISSSDFNLENYTKKSLKSGDILQNGTPVYKLITSEYWNLVLPLSDEDAGRLAEDTRVTLYLPNISHEVYGDIEVIRNGSEQYAKITLDKLMVNYCDERFLNIEIVMDKDEGLAIPNTSILEKSVIKLPREYLVEGNNESSSSVFVNVRTLDEEGNLSVELVEPDIIDSDEEYVYINPNTFAENAVLIRNNSDETLPISQASRVNMKGVYNINRGIAAFVKITILNSDEEFTIVKAGDKYSLAQYDRIILDASMAEEGTLIR